MGLIWKTKAALRHRPGGAAIINTTSVTACKGRAELVDHASTKGAILAVTRRRSQALWRQRRIRVNAVAPGPIWTPLMPSRFDAGRAASHGKGSSMGRAGQPDEWAPCCIVVASEPDNGYIFGQTLHPGGGTVVDR